MKDDVGTKQIAPNGYSTLFVSPRLAPKLESIRVAAKSVTSLKTEIRRVGAMTGSSQLHRTPCLVTICSFDESKPVLKCMTPKPGKGEKGEFLDFVNYAGKKLGIKATKAYLITNLLQEISAPLDEAIRRLRRERSRLDPHLLTELSSLASGDIVLIEDSDSEYQLAQEEPFDFDKIRSSIPNISQQYIRSLVDEDEERKDLLMSMTELPKVNGFKILDRLGKGGIRGYSFIAEDDRGFQVVLKEYKPDRSMNFKALSACLTSQTHTMLAHVNILPVREFFVSDSSDHTCISCWSVQEYFPCRSVLDELENQKQGNKSTVDAFDIAKTLDLSVQALRGLTFLHDVLKRVHGSVKPSNLLLDARDSGLTLKLAHLSCGEVFQPTWKGATRFRSPESLESGTISKMDDMFSFGCCIAAMATGVADRERGIKGHFGNNSILIQETIRDVSRRGSEVITSVVRNLLGKDQHRLSAAAVLSAFEIALDSEKGKPTRKDPMQIVRSHQMSAKGPGAYAGVPELLAAVKKAPPQKAEEYLQRLCALCTDMAECIKVIQHAGHVLLVEQLMSTSERAVECAAVLIGQLCTSDSNVKTAFHAQKTVDALLAALDAHKSRPLVIEKLSNTLTILCTDSSVNCEDLEKADGVSKLHKVTCDGSAWTGTPSAKKKCSLALRVVSMNRLQSSRPLDKITVATNGTGTENVQAVKNSSRHMIRFKAAVRALNCTRNLADKMKEKEKWDLEQLVLEAFQSAQQMSKLFQEGLEPSMIHDFFEQMFAHMRMRKLTVGAVLDVQEICCVVRRGTIQIALAGHTLEFVSAVSFCAGHLLRLQEYGIMIQAEQDSELLVISRSAMAKIFEEYPVIWKTLEKMMHTVELGDRTLQIKSLTEKRKIQETEVRRLLQLELKKQATSEEVESASKSLEEIEAVLMDLRLTVNKRLDNQQKNKQRRSSTAYKVAAPLQSEQKEMFVPAEMRNQLSTIVQSILDPFPKCIDAMRLLRDAIIKDGPVRQEAGQEGAIQALLNHCKGPSSSNISRVLAVEALLLLCSGNNGNKKRLAQSQGVQMLVSMLECNLPRQFPQGCPVDASNADIYNAVEVCRGKLDKDLWISDKRAALLDYFPQSGESQRLSSLLRKTLEQCSCYVLKGATREDACSALAKWILQSILDSIQLQEHAAHALWVICEGDTDQEAYNRFVLGKAGGIGALVEMIEHCTDRAQEYSAAALYCVCADNLVNRLIFYECRGVTSLCKLLSSGTANAKEHAAATLRVACDATRRVIKGSASTSKEGLRVKGESDDINMLDKENNALNTDTNQVESICMEAINLGSVQNLTALLRHGTVRAKTEAAWSIHNMCWSNAATRDVAATSGTVEALIELSYSEFREHQEHSAAALYALCSKHESNCKRTRRENGIPALVKIITHSHTVAKENACMALLAVMEAYPRAAFEIGQKGKEGLTRLSTDGHTDVKLYNLAKRVLQVLRMIVSTPMLYHNNDWS